MLCNKNNYYFDWYQAVQTIINYCVMYFFLEISCLLFNLLLVVSAVILILLVCELVCVDVCVCVSIFVCF